MTHTRIENTKGGDETVMMPLPETNQAILLNVSANGSGDKTTASRGTVSFHAHHH